MTVKSVVWTGGRNVWVNFTSSDNTFDWGLLDGLGN